MVRPRPRLTVDAVDEMKSRLAAGRVTLAEVTSAHSVICMQCQVAIAPGTRSKRLPRAFPFFLAFAFCYSLFTLVSQISRLRYHSLIHPHSIESLAASSTQLGYLVLSRLSTSFITWFPSFFFSETHLLQRSLLLLHHTRPSMLGLVSLDWYSYAS